MQTGLGRVTKSIMFDVKTPPVIKREGGSDEGKVFNRVRGLQKEIDDARARHPWNISRYVSTATEEAEIDLASKHRELVDIEKAIRTATTKLNEFLQEFGLLLLP